MVLNLFILIGSLYLLYKGSDFLVKHSSLLAKHFGVAPLIIGLTIVALGTSMPEIVTTFIASLQGDYGVAMGNIIGTNIANIGLVLGIAALIRPIDVKDKTLRREIPFAAAAVLLVWLFALDGSLNRWEGIILLILSVTFTLFMIVIARRERIVEEVEGLVGKIFTRIHFKDSILTIIGLGLLIIGAKLLVESAVAIANDLNVNPFVVAVTVVAIGTSIPELATSVVAAFKKQTDIVLGAIVGSNILNILVALGLSAVFLPVVVDEKIARVDIPVMVGVTFLMVLMLKSGNKLTRREGFVLVLLYGVYIYSVINGPGSTFDI